MSQSFIPQGTPLYTADIRGDVHLVIGWNRPQEIFDEPGEFYWRPVLAKLAPPDAQHPGDVCAENTTTFIEPPESGGDYSLSFAATLEEARVLATRWVANGLNGPVSRDDPHR